MRSGAPDDPVDDDASEGEPQPRERRAAGGRRRSYNRRMEDREVSPPYFEAFDRIAVALEHIEELLRARYVKLPDADVRAGAERR